MKNCPKVRPVLRLGKPALIGLLLGAAPVGAAQAIDLSETLSAQLEAGQSTEYALTRCAGLHFALIAWAGGQRLGSETVEAAKQNIFNMIQGATVIRANAGDPQATANVVAAVHQFSGSYLTHFSNISGGEYGNLSGDDLFDSDGEICAAFIEELR